MMAARPFKSFFQAGGRNALDLPVAGLAALAAAFAAFAVPQDLLSRAVVATGLPSILSAAQPPLGLTARVAIAVGGAAIVFGLVFVLLRLLDRSGMGGAAPAEEDDALILRVRRRDVHPDAPARRPISAVRDLGEPAPPSAPRAAAPVRAEEAEPVAPRFEPEPEPAPFAQVWPEPAPAPIVVPEPEPPVEAPPPVAAPQPAPPVAAAPAPAPTPAPAPEPPRQAEMPTSIAELMERLEQGLARRRIPVPAPADAAAPPQVFPEAPEAPDDRLQSAIASLQRLAARSS